MIYSVLLIVAICLLWLISGQMIKGLRRYAIPVIATAYVVMLKDKRKRWLAGLMLILSAILSLGYGENSDIRKFLGGSDFLTRIVISIMIASIPITYIFLSQKHTNICDTSWSILTIIIVNVVAWQVHAGSLGKIGRYDILIEDICRALALGISIVIM